ncbi:MAG TPA: hypothetical protein VFA41_24065 [Ktedonobacteraceae bacterium]|nr:hypothetical protein [Ktedonobacteraceae bacterium]
MIKGLFRLLLIVVVVGVLIFLFAPRFFAQAGTSLLNSGSAVTGFADYLPKNTADANNNLQISLQNLAPNTRYEITLDQGACGGYPSIDIGSITSDSNGNLNGIFHISNLDLSTPWFIDIHEGASASGTSVGCGQLETNQSTVGTAATPTPLDGSSSSVSLNVGQSGANVSNSTSSASGNGTSTNPNSPPGLPNTGVAPAGKNSYDNHTYPRKY